jgi:transposase-like protein
VEDNCEELERVYDERYSKQHGCWRPIIRSVIEEFLDCGDLRHGFARVWCSACRSEYLLAFSCKRRYFCPSCHQKRVVLFAERVEQEVLEKVPVRQYVVTIPKMLRFFFKHDRKLLGLLSRCFYQTLKQFLQEAYPERQAVPGMIVSIQTYGNDLLRFHPHLHCLVSDGLFLPDGSFLPVPAPDPEVLMRAFRHRLLKALLARQIITEQRVELLLSWRHPGFSVYQGQPVPPEDTAARERLARYILHAPFSQKRMIYDRSARTVACESKKYNGNWQNTPGGITVSPALDWLAALVTHLPDKGQQLLRFYGRYSNVCQGRKRRAAGRAVQPVDKQAQGEDDLFRKQCRSNWARLIKKILEVDPLVCPKCHGRMTIISFLEDPAVVKRILVHLNLWEVPERSPPSTNPPRELIYDWDFFRGLVN